MIGAQATSAAQRREMHMSERPSRIAIVTGHPSRSPPTLTAWSLIRETTRAAMEPAGVSATGFAAESLEGGPVRKLDSAPRGVRWCRAEEEVGVAKELLPGQMSSGEARDGHVPRIVRR